MKSNNLCIVDGCNSKVLAKNCCSKHYSQIRRNGEIKDNKPKKKQMQSSLVPVHWEWRTWILSYALQKDC